MPIPYGGHTEYTPIDAARDGRGIHLYTLGYPGGGPVVLGGDISFSMGPNQRVFVTGITVGVRTPSDWCLFDIGYVDAAGTYQRVSQQFYLANPAIITVAVLTFDHQFNPPLMASYAAGARAVTIRTDVADDNTQVEIGWDGWFEPE